jgi:pilus assembly protein FimV
MSAQAENSTEITDPDDIDAILESLADDIEPESTEHSPYKTEDLSEPIDITESLQTSKPVEISKSTDMADAEDIDAILESLADDIEPESTEHSPYVNETVETATDVKDPETTELREITDPEELDAILESLAGEIEPESVDDTPHSSEATDDHQNITADPLIDDFSEDYVSKFLSADFNHLTTEQQNSSVESDRQDPPTGVTDDNVDIDIDGLLAGVNEDTLSANDLGDIGDDILGSQGITNKDNEHEQLSTDFDESTLNQLLNDEKESKTAAELTPDYTDSSVLADLLADEDSENSSDQFNQTSEINDIEQLDDIDFDELLSSIEEETTQNNTESLDLSSMASDDEENTDINDNSDELSANKDQDFIAVDDLIADTLDDVSAKKSTEPYQQSNIDVGLGEFPEFTNSVNDLDVDDEDDSGVAAKLDLAKVYIEIGDLENAEVILKDVVSLGDEEQQKEAKLLLEHIK